MDRSSLNTGIERRAAIYARFSSDLQRDRSIDDQVALCRDYAAKNGYDVVCVFHDRALTGASLHDRIGIKALLAAARESAFDFVLAESMSRIGRDQEDRAAVRKRLTFCGVELVTPADGVVAPLVDGIRAVIDSVQLDDMKAAVRRGMRGVVTDGRHAGGRAYGYRAVPGRPGELEILPDQAAVVRRIFEDYAAGDTGRTIAARLNAERVPAPRGDFWQAATVTGHTARGTGIVQNRLYVGEIVWNRGATARDPDSHKRIRRGKPQGEWVRAAAPHLRIVDDALFAAAQARRKLNAAKPRQVRRNRGRVLSGLLRCGSCGAGMSIKDFRCGHPRIVCTRAKEGGACGHRRAYRLDLIERRVLAGLKTRLGSRPAITAFIRGYNDERQKEARDRDAGRSRIEARMASIDRQLTRAVQAVIEERISNAEADRVLPQLRSERQALADQLAAIGEPAKVIALHPAAVAEYLRDLDRLAELVNADLAEGDTGAANTIRSLVETVTVMPAEAFATPALRVQGRLERLLDLDGLSGDYVGGSVGAGGPIHSIPPRAEVRFLFVLAA